MSGEQQARQAVVELFLAEHAAAGEQPCQQRMHAGLLQRPDAARRDLAGDDLHSAASTVVACVRVNRLFTQPHGAARLQREAARAAVAAERELTASPRR